MLWPIKSRIISWLFLLLPKANSRVVMSRSLSSARSSVSTLLPYSLRRLVPTFFFLSVISMSFPNFFCGSEYRATYFTPFPVVQLYVIFCGHPSLVFWKKIKSSSLSLIPTWTFEMFCRRAFQMYIHKRTWCCRLRFPTQFYISFQSAQALWEP